MVGQHASKMLGCMLTVDFVELSRTFVAWRSVPVVHMKTNSLWSGELWQTSNLDGAGPQLTA